ncbi:MAG: LytTR family transcriptional regulator DNA-binding domain-containing protein [Bacteroidales bacterium]|jgi:DNA-binding LytR/AlgR family response regulator|nr:LytTR family transcriptional regulator DNA-binding domain-containing protein [Bacteroidales bacterium]
MMNVHKFESQGEVFIEVKDSGSRVKIFIHSILYIEAKNGYTFLHLKDRKDELISTRRLNEYEHKFVKYGFARIHHNILVNGIHISRRRYVSKTKLVVEVNDTELPVSKQKRINLRKLFSDNSENP